MTTPILAKWGEGSVSLMGFLDQTCGEFQVFLCLPLCQVPSLLVQYRPIRSSLSKIVRNLGLSLKHDKQHYVVFFLAVVGVTRLSILLAIQNITKLPYSNARSHNNLKHQKIEHDLK